jgi:DNA-binding transcriptional ArsR family regulator
MVKFVKNEPGQKNKNMDYNKLTVEQLQHASEMLKAIAHPQRIAILAYLNDNGSQSVQQIQQKFNIEQAVTSHHLGILKNKDIVGVERQGKNCYYKIKNNNLAGILECLYKCACLK